MMVITFRLFFLSFVIATGIYSTSCEISEVTGPQLFSAAREGDNELLRQALDAGADSNIRDEFGCSLLHAAIETSRLATIQLLLSYKPDLEMSDDQFGIKPLLAATIYGLADVATMLLDAGAYVDSRNNDGMTPLMVAVFQADVHLVKLFIERKANINIVSNDGKTALHGAVLGAVKRKTPDDTIECLKALFLIAVLGLITQSVTGRLYSLLAVIISFKR